MMKTGLSNGEEMFEMVRGTNSISFRISCIFPNVRRVLEASGAFLKEFGVRESSGPSVVFWELLANAVQHGNRNHGEGRINASIEHIRDRVFKVVVEDTGEGFNYLELNMALPEDPRNVKRRGYILIHALSNKLEFNEKGNCVTAFVSAN